MGYVHPSGEVHIMDNNEWVSCPGQILFIYFPKQRKEKAYLTGHNLNIGQDDPSTQCIVGDVPTIFQGDSKDHVGPYNGVTMGC